MISNLPNQILNVLSSAGYEAYYVGGCVRDTILGRPVHDWDVTTSALPEQVMACFDHCVPTGLKHGTVTVLLDGLSAEVTTFRTDGSYRDGRRPENVTFVRSLREDLARRDFTINAMAMDAGGEITDLYGGREDLAQHVIRCVGDPEQRFREDALRMLRALRFSAQLGFAVEAETAAAIVHCVPLCRGLSAERVRDEVEKTLLSDHPERLRDMAELGLLEICRPDCGRDTGVLARLPEIREVRWAGLCGIWPELDLTALRLDKRTAQDAMFAGRCEVPKTRVAWKRLAAEQGRNRMKLVADLNGASSVAEEILTSGECVALGELAVSGRDFPAVTGKSMGRLLTQILNHVLEHPEDNDREKLLKFYRRLD